MGNFPRMVVIHRHNEALLPRLLGLKDHSPFILVLDSLAQSADYLVHEALHRVPQETNAVLLSFETKDSPKKIGRVVDCHKQSLDQIIRTARGALVPEKRNLLIIDSLSCIPTEQLSSFLASLMGRNISLLAVYHVPIREPLRDGQSCYPSALSLLRYLATSILEIRPQTARDLELNEGEYPLDNLCIPLGSNQPTFVVSLTSRRRSGRGISAEFKVDFNSHTIEYIPPKSTNAQVEEDTSLLEGLTTFNLGTTERQKLAKDSTELPFYQAQEFGEGAARGGAIVYEFEKDDDFDEEDPFEDPF